MGQGSDPAVSGQQEGIHPRSPVPYRTHTLTLGGTSEPPFNLLCMFFWNVGVNSLAIKAPSLKSNPELFCYPFTYNAKRQLWLICSSFPLQMCHFSQKNNNLEIFFLHCKKNINMAAKYKEKQMYCNITPCRNVFFFPPRIQTGRLKPGFLDHVFYDLLNHCGCFEIVWSQGPHGMFTFPNRSLFTVSICA